MASTIGSHTLKSTGVSLTRAVHCWFLLKNCRDLVVPRNNVTCAYLLKPVLNGSSVCLLALRLICQVCFQCLIEKLDILTYFCFSHSQLLVLSCSGLTVYPSHSGICIILAE